MSSIATEPRFLPPRKRFLLFVHPFSMIDRELNMDDAPILTTLAPFLRNIHHNSKAQNLQQVLSVVETFLALVTFQS